MRSLFVIAAVFAAPATTNAQQEVSFVPSANQTIGITVGGKPFATYRSNMKGEFLKPFMLPVRAADGTILTRSLKDPEDHPHHKGVWVAVDEINGVKFWAEKGLIRTRAVAVPTTRPTPQQLVVSNTWMSLDKDPIVDEETIIMVYPNRLVTYDITFVASHGPVEFGDTKEGLLGFRMVNALREKETGKVINADGEKGTKNCWGQPSAWVDYYGKINDKTYGIALFDHPKNMRKSRYHVRNYGLFSISPFGEKAYSKGKEDAKHVKLAKGEKLRLRYALYVHDGDTKEGKVAETYKKYVELSAKTMQK